MYNELFKVDYSVLINNYKKILFYAAESSGSFSIITEQLKPYASDNPKCRHDFILATISDCLLSQDLEIKSWPGTKTKAKHMVMNKYRITRKTKNWLKECPNLFQPGQELPQDISFYRNDAVWLFTTTHEKNMGLIRPTHEDILFFSHFVEKP